MLNKSHLYEKCSVCNVDKVTDVRFEWSNSFVCLGVLITMI